MWAVFFAHLGAVSTSLAAERLEGGAKAPFLLVGRCFASKLAIAEQGSDMAFVRCLSVDVISSLTGLSAERGS